MGSFESLVFFRGISEDISSELAFVGTTIKNRRPRNTPEHLHKAADAWFLENFGENYRSQALFLSASQRTATAFAKTPAHVFRIIPLGAYKYCWSSKVVDMLQLVQENKQDTAEGFKAKLYAAKYQNDDLQKAAATGNEVMLFCENYIAVPISMLGIEEVTGIIIAK